MRGFGTAGLVWSARAGAQSLPHTDAHASVVAGSSIRTTLASQPIAGLDSLLALALTVNPGIKAAVHRVGGGRARVAPAGARPDPMLTAGIVNLPLARETSTAASPHGTPTTTGVRDAMTMQMVGISQTLPYPGKLALATRTAQDELAAAEADLRATRVEVTAQVKREYYALAYLDDALHIVPRTQGVLASLIATSEAQYAVGNGQQADVLRARVEAAHLGEQASDLEEQRHAALARLNALLDRASDTPIERAAIPERVARAAVADSAAHVRFVSASLGARAADSPLLPLDSLQALAVANNPMLRAHEARIAGQIARVALARKAYLPDVDVMVSYGHRPGFVDMVSATVSLPIPIQKRRKQDSDVASAAAELAALEAEHRRAVNELNADIARQVSDLERARTQLALAVRAVLPQSRAALSAATSAYQVGRLPFASVMDAQATVFNAETAYYRSLADFAAGLAELERSVGTGVLR